MSDKIKESILAQLTADRKAALCAITKENGYTWSPLAVEEERKDFKPDNLYPYIVLVRDECAVVGEDDDVDIVDIPYVVFYFDIYNDESKNDDEIVHHFRNIIPDIVKAWRAGQEQGICCGGLAEKTITENFSDGVARDKAMVGYMARIRFVITCRIDSLDYYKRG